MPSEGQKDIEQNRPPRVHITYGPDTDGGIHKIELPFVVGVLADLMGKSNKPMRTFAERKFEDIDDQSFDTRLAAMAPRVAFRVPNTLTGEGELSVDITFTKMDDFSPAEIASKVPELNELLKARTQLANLLTLMDGRTAAEDVINQILNDPQLLQSLAGRGKPAENAAETNGSEQ